MEAAIDADAIERIAAILGFTTRGVWLLLKDGRSVL